jgi:type II secretory pathway pseudopilin PulG
MGNPTTRIPDARGAGAPAPENFSGAVRDRRRSRLASKDTMPHAPKTARHARSGFTIVEAVIAIAIIVAALLTMIGAVSSSMRVTRTVDEREAVIRALSAKIAELEGTDFDKLVACYDSDPNNDPLGPGTAAGTTFDIPNYHAPAGAPSEMAGEVVLPLLGGQLREDLEMPELGMPRDLNGDGVVDAKDHKSDYQLLPVLVKANWHGVDGDSTVTIQRLLAGK